MFQRLWWATYIIDRHSSLSFNLRFQMTDQRCQQLQLPCSDAIWESSLLLQECQREHFSTSPRGVGYKVHSLDLFGIFLPLLR